MFASLLVGVGPQLHRDVRFQPTLGVRVAWDDAVDGWMPLRNPHDLSERDQRLAAKQPDALKVLLRSCASEAFAALLHSRIDAFPAGRLEFASAPSASASGERSENAADVLAARSGGDSNCEPVSDAFVNFTQLKHRFHGPVAVLIDSLSRSRRSIRSTCADVARPGRAARRTAADTRG
jgi:hypothetical protein